MNSKCGYIYILTNYTNSTLYIGVTSNLIKRIYEHKTKVVEGFSKRYNLTKLVYYKKTDTIAGAIEYEKYLKGKIRKYKEGLINSLNPEWLDLYNEII